MLKIYKTKLENNKNLTALTPNVVAVRTENKAAAIRFYLGDWSETLAPYDNRIHILDPYGKSYMTEKLSIQTDEAGAFLELLITSSLCSIVGTYSAELSSTSGSVVFKSLNKIEYIVNEAIDAQELAPGAGAQKVPSFIQDAEKVLDKANKVLEVTGKLPELHTQDKTSLVAAVNEIQGSNNPQGVYSNLAALQAAKPSGAPGVHVAADTAHWYYWSGAAWTDGGAYFSDISYKEVKKDLDKLNNNIQNTGDDMHYLVDLNPSNGYYVEVATGALIAQADASTTDYKDISIFNAYIYSFTSEEGRNHLMAFYDEDKTFISGAVQTGRGDWTIRIPEGAKYTRISYYTAYASEFFIKGKLKNNAVKRLINRANALEVIVHGGETSDLFVKENATENGYYAAGREEGHPLGEWVENTRVSMSEFLDVKGFKTVKLTIPAEATTTTHQWTFKDAAGSFISGGWREGSASEEPATVEIAVPAGAEAFGAAFLTTSSVSIYFIADGIAEGSKMKNKRLGIVGDSISTYSGFIPSGYEALYPAGNVNSVAKTWWKQLLDSTGMTLTVNASWSGSTVSGNAADTTGVVGCSDARVNALTDVDGNTPDIIICFMGINDFAKDNGISCGTYDGTTAPNATKAATSITDAYGLLLSKLENKYPAAQIFICRILPERNTGSMNASQSGGFPNVNPTDGVSLPELNAKLEKLAKAFNCGVIPMDATGITFYNVASYTVDSLHPNDRLTPKMAEVAKQTLQKMAY